MHLIWCTFSTASLGTTSVWPGTCVYTIVNTRSIRTLVTIFNVAGILYLRKLIQESDDLVILIHNLHKTSSKSKPDVLILVKHGTLYYLLLIKKGCSSGQPQRTAHN